MSDCLKSSASTQKYFDLLLEWKGDEIFNCSRRLRSSSDVRLIQYKVANNCCVFVSWYLGFFIIHSITKIVQLYNNLTMCCYSWCCIAKTVTVSNSVYTVCSFSVFVIYFAFEIFYFRFCNYLFIDINYLSSN